MIMKCVTIIFGMFLTVFLIPENKDVMELSKKLKIDDDEETE